jgi:hypothetical protein
MNFLDNFEHFLLEIVFLGLLVFSLKGLKILKIAFFQKKQIFSKNPILRIFEDFQALLEKKVEVLRKKFPG